MTLPARFSLLHSNVNDFSLPPLEINKTACRLTLFRR